MPKLSRHSPKRPLIATKGGRLVPVAGTSTHDAPARQLEPLPRRLSKRDRRRRAGTTLTDRDLHLLPPRLSIAELGERLSRMPPIPRRPDLRLKRRRARTPHPTLPQRTATTMTSNHTHSRRPTPAHTRLSTHQRHGLALNPTHIKFQRAIDRATAIEPRGAASRAWPALHRRQAHPYLAPEKPLNHADQRRISGGGGI